MRKRILIVDDEPIARQALGYVLETNYDVVLAEDGLRGVEMAMQSPPDLIVSDVNMPNLSGFEMVKRIRKLLNRKVPVIFTTARNRPNDIIAGIQAGARHYLVKPIQISELEFKIKQTLLS